MSTFDTVSDLMTEQFGKDTLIAIATSDGNTIHNRMVDSYYEDGAFYVSTYALSNKMRQIADHPQVAIASPDWFSGHGIGENLGWILDPKNAELRDKLRKAFAGWYEFAANEQDKNSCILKITLTDGMLIKDHHAIRYQVDFTNKSAKVSTNFGPFE